MTYTAIRHLGKTRTREVAVSESWPSILKPMTMVHGHRRRWGRGEQNWQAQRDVLICGEHREEVPICKPLRVSEETEPTTLQSWLSSLQDLKKQISLRIALGNKTKQIQKPSWDLPSSRFSYGARLQLHVP